MKTFRKTVWPEGKGPTPCSGATRGPPVVLPQDFLAENFLLRADGVLVSRVDTRVYRAGDPVSCVGTLGYEYAKVDFNGRRIYPLVHRIVIAIVSGRWPEELVDHINGVRNDNRPENLREVNRFENARNTPLTRARTP